MSREKNLQDLLTCYGYDYSEANTLAKEIIRNLDNYAKIHDVVFKRLGQTK